jgi:CDP-diacylglycerol--glycerol-3-phosphate 3-phosphatidyltransferase
VTDLLDGRLARSRGLITDFGKIADPIADKALTGAALVTLSALGELAWWVTAVILAREISVTLLRFWVIRRGVIAASRGGKLKTLLQVVAIALYVLPGPPAVVREVVMAAAVAVTVVTGIDYETADALLKRAAWNVKAAIVMQKTGLSRTQALKRLRKADDSIRDAIGEDIEPRLRELLKSP